MKVILQKNLYLRSEVIFDNAMNEYGIDFILTEPLDEKTMLDLHTEGVNCIVIGAEKYSHEFYNNLRSGSAIIRYGVGYDSVPIETCRERGIIVAFTPDTLTQSVAESAMALLLSTARNIPRLDQEVRTGKWQGCTGQELAGKTLAVIGYGKIGRCLTGIAVHGFGMKVKAYDKLLFPNDKVADLISGDFSEVVADADFVSLHLSLTPENRNFINRSRLGQMKEGVCIVNTARGDILDEVALYGALESGQVRCAALDVFKNEPYHPIGKADLRKLDNVILQPHCGSNTIEANNNMAWMCIRNILGFYGDKEEMMLIPELA